MSLGLHYKNQEKIFQEIETDTPYLEYPLFQNTGIVRHGFSTRLGGVSEGCYSSLNLSFTRGDKEESVRENFRRIGDAMGIKCENMVFTQQTHTANVRVVMEADRGMGITRKRSYTDVDGLVTNVPGICLVTFLPTVCLCIFGSGEKGGRVEPLWMERNGIQDWKSDCGADAERVWIQSS